MSTTRKTESTEARHEQQLTRLRNCLADALTSDRASRVIQRLETMIQKRWALIEKNRSSCPQPAPA